MPVYSYKCGCGNVFDELFLSFSSAESAEKKGITCPKCGKNAKKNDDPKESMKGGGFKKYGLWTYQ